MIIEKVKRLYRRRKAVSPVIATILLIALTVSAVAIVYFVVLPMFRSYKLEAAIIKVYDTDKDSQYNRVQLQLINSGTKPINITKLIIWTCIKEDLGNEENWFQHTGWSFDNPADSYVTQSEVTEAFASGGIQISLTIDEDTYYRLEIEYTGKEKHYFTDWALLNDQVDLNDLLSIFDTFNLTAAGFEGTVDDIKNPENNYLTDNTGDYQLVNGSINYLPVLNETELIPFLITNSVVVFPSTSATGDPRAPQQTLDFSSMVFRARKFFLVGLAGSWGDEFGSSDWALNLTIEYTDGSYDEYLLGHDYIDDWYYQSNSPHVCTSAPYGKITEIDLGFQLEEDATEEGSHIHTHTTRFYFDFYKYVKTIIFTDPNDDQSGPHLLSLTFA